MASTPPAATGSILVCGMGQVGYRIVSLLRRLGEPTAVVTLEARPDWVRAAQESGARVTLADARDPQVLEAAGLGTARALIVATDQDAVNIEIALDAGQARPDLPVVVRLFDQTLARRFETTYGVRRALSMSALAAPAFAAAAMGEDVLGSFRFGDTPLIVGRMAVGPGTALSGLSVAEIGGNHRLSAVARRHGEGEWDVGLPADAALMPSDRVVLVGEPAAWREVVSPPGAAPQASRVAALGVLMRQLRPAAARDFARGVWGETALPIRAAFAVLNLLIVLSIFVFQAALDLSLVDALYFVVTTVTTTGYGDITPLRAPDAVKLYAVFAMVLGSLTLAMLYSILTDFIVTTRFQQLLGRYRVPHAGHVVVVGLGNVGYRVAEELRRNGERVAVIDRDADGEFVPEIRAHIPVLVADGRSPDALARAGVERARAIVAATNDDAANLAVALVARQIAGSIRAIVRIFDADFARKVQGHLDVSVAMSASMTAAPTFVAAALYPGVCHALTLDARLVVFLQRMVDGDWVGRRPSEVSAAEGAVTLLRRAPGGRTRPAGDDVPFQTGEEVLAVVSRPLRS